jgi:hypothetical protein
LEFFAPKPATMRDHSSRAARSLATSMKKFMPTPQKKLRRGAKLSIAMPRGDAGAQILGAVGERVCQLEVRRRPGLLHVIAGDADAVEFWHVLRGIREDIRHDAHRRRRRINVRIADHELF